MNLEKDCAEKLQTNIDQALENMRKEFRDKEEGMKKKFNESIAKERKHLSGRQTMELDQLRKQHEKEIDVSARDDHWFDQGFLCSRSSIKPSPIRISIDHEQKR